MVRVVIPKGELKDFADIQCFKEKSVSFAEKTKRVVIQAEGMDAEVTGIMSHHFAGEIMWGNLSSDKVREILSEMAEKGYYNFLDRGYEVIHSAKEIQSLNGRPYYLERPLGRCFGNMGRGCNMNFPQNSCFGEEEDVFLDEDDE